MKSNELIRALVYFNPIPEPNAPVFDGRLPVPKEYAPLPPPHEVKPYKYDPHVMYEEVTVIQESV